MKSMVMNIVHLLMDSQDITRCQLQNKIKKKQLSYQNLDLFPRESCPSD
jgi:hypothetical protein